MGSNKWVSYKEWIAQKEWYNHMDKIAIALQTGLITLETATKLIEEYGRK